MKQKRMKFFGFLLGALIFSNGFAAEPSSKNLVFFGDSLTDMGYQNNNPDLPAGKSPIWTSPGGHTWAYYLAQKMGAEASVNNLAAAYYYDPVPDHIIPTLKGSNFAAGGAVSDGRSVTFNRDYKAPSLLEQVTFYTQLSTAESNNVDFQNTYFFIWAGSNDFIKLLEISAQLAKSGRVAHEVLLMELTQTGSKVSSSIEAAVSKLSKFGAQHIVVLLIPDLSQAPFISELSEAFEKNGADFTRGELKDVLRAAVYETNYRINTLLADSNVKIIDPNEAFALLLATASDHYFREDPLLFGRSDAFLIHDPSGCACPSGELAFSCVPKNSFAPYFVFEDGVHPTDQTHQILADYVFHQVNA